jgi:thioester reductase-like protein
MMDEDRLPESVARARSELSSRRDDLSAAKRELLAKRLGGKLAAGARKELAGRAAARPDAPQAAGFAEILGEPPLDLATEAVLDPTVCAAPAAPATAQAKAVAGAATGAPTGASAGAATGAVTGASAGAATAASSEAATGASIGAATGASAGEPEPAKVLLTGATGFLGAFLLAELLRQTRADVLCLVRAGSDEEAAGRLRENLAAHEVWDAAAAPRIQVLLGDLARPLLGLSEERFDEVGAEVDAIVHNGAWVHSSYPYSVLKAANVLGTRETLRLAFRAKIKPLHFISTLDVFFAPEYSRLAVIPEDDGLDHPEGQAIGYAQCKWVAEKLVMAARRRGLPASVYRFGRISWHSRSGIWNPDDALRRVVDACLELGSAPDLDVGLVLTPVDYIARAVVALSRARGSAGKTFHLINPHPISSRQLAEWTRSAGAASSSQADPPGRPAGTQPLVIVPAEDWLEAARGKLPESLLPNLSRLRALASSGAEGDDGQRQGFDCRNAIEGLAGTGIVCPPIGEDSLRAYLARYALELSQT